MTDGGGAPFTAETFQNQFLSAGADVVDAVVTVAAAADPGAGAATTRAGDRAEIVVVDCSGSMGSSRKMEAAKAAAAAAVDVIDDGVAFAIIAGDHEAKLLWPTDGRSFGTAGLADRSAAKSAIANLEAAGGTAIGTWLDLARRLFSNIGA
ncbi:MAG TPA: VWA domain-containing protein, partial [Acidimicrobiales bacterium]